MWVLGVNTGEWLKKGQAAGFVQLVNATIVISVNNYLLLLNPYFCLMLSHKEKHMHDESYNNFCVCNSAVSRCVCAVY